MLRYYYFTTYFVRYSGRFLTLSNQSALTFSFSANCLMMYAVGCRSPLIYSCILCRRIPVILATCEGYKCRSRISCSNRCANEKSIFLCPIDITSTALRAGQMNLHASCLFHGLRRGVSGGCAFTREKFSPNPTPVRSHCNGY